MTMLDLRLILVLCCSLQLGRLQNYPFPYLCPPEFPHQLGTATCYSFNEDELSFQEALASCTAKGGKLAEPRVQDQQDFILGYSNPDDPYHSYWFGVTDSAGNGVWTYPSDNSPLTNGYLQFVLQNWPPRKGENCMLMRRTLAILNFESAYCEEKARYICQYVPPLRVCGIREGGELLLFNATYKAQFVTLPCDYTLASIVCGDYDVRVYGTSVEVQKSIFSPRSARVVVQRALTNETLVSAQVSRDAIAKSTDGKNIWTVTAGAWSAEVRETFDHERQASVIKFGDVGQVDFSASTDGVENGLYVRCKDVRSSVELPGSLCEAMEGSTNWSRALTEMTNDGRLHVFMRAIFRQNAGEQLQCSAIANKVRSCPDEVVAVRTCSPIFIYKRLAKCFTDGKLWFDRCLDAYCNNDVVKCKEMKTKMADCGITFRRVPSVMLSLVTFLNSC